MEEGGHRGGEGPDALEAEEPRHPGAPGDDIRSQEVPAGAGAGEGGAGEVQVQVEMEVKVHLTRQRRRRRSRGEEVARREERCSWSKVVRRRR